MRSKSDYFLFREKDRRLIKCCRLIQPRYHDSDDRALDANIRARPGEIVRYVEGRVKLPVQGARMSRLRGRHFLRSCPPPWRRCRGGSARAGSPILPGLSGFFHFFSVFMLYRMSAKSILSPKMTDFSLNIPR